MKHSSGASRRTIVRRSLPLLLLLAAPLAPGQTAEQRLQTAFDNLRGNRSVFMRLDGTEIIGADSRTIVVDCYWDSTATSGQPVSRLRIDLFKDATLQRRWIGDGVSLWAVDALKNAYSTTAYGAYSGSEPTNYNDRLLQSAVASARGAAVFPARLLRDVFSGSAASYKAWIPGVAPTMAGEVITYQVGAPLTRQVQFVLDTSGNLSSIAYFDQKGDQQVSYTLTFYTFLSPPADWNFNYVPSGGSVPISPGT